MLFKATMIRCVIKRWRQLLAVVLFASSLITLYMTIGVLKWGKDLLKTRNNGHRFYGNRAILLPDVEQACIQPQLPIWDPSINFTSVCRPIVCSQEENWVYTANGRFYISAKAVAKHGDVVCVHIPVINNHDEVQYLSKTVPMLNGSLLQTDVFKVLCKAKDGTEYKNVHVGVANVSTQRSVNNNTNRMQHGDYNVLILGFDSMSRQAIQRNLPETVSFFEDKLGGVRLEGFNVLGDGTTAALLPMLTGRTETEVPEVRRGKPNAQPVDEVAEFIWSRYEKRGYTTHWAEDMPRIGTFQYRMLGFKKQPVHHYLRPYFLEALRAESYFDTFCMGSVPFHKVFINWIKESLASVPGLPFFTFGFFSAYSHNDNSCVSQADKDLLAFLQLMSRQEILHKTFIFLMSDHGLRIGESRKTEQGKLEERMPYFAVYMPESYIAKYPEKYDSLLGNSKRLITSFDIYATLRDILGDINEPSLPPRALTIFSPIPASRTCADAQIEPHWCACLKWENVPVDKRKVKEVANFAVEQFNSRLIDYTDICHKLNLKKIIKAIKLLANNNVLKFKQSKDIHGRIPDLTDKMKASRTYYQITIETKPGGGIFEYTASTDNESGRIYLNENEVSRINMYGDSPRCIQVAHPELRPFCVCRN